MVSENDHEDVEAIQIRPRQLETGMVLARTVHSGNGCVLMSEEKELNSRDIERLKEWDTRYVYIYPDSSNESSLAEAS